MPGDDTGRGTKTIAGWQALFEQLSLADAIERDGFADVEATQIAQIAGREPRLMTKFDTRESRPLPLKPYTIFATRNGAYRVCAGDGYEDVPQRATLSRFRPRSTDLETLSIDCTTESQVLDMAHASGILEDFTGEHRLWLTGRGRRRCKYFEFSFEGVRGPIAMNVDGVQVEVDGGYEGDRIYVFEAKLGLRDNFLVRQLYYPYRMWNAEGVAKPVVPIFVCYSSRQVFLYEYEFTSLDRYHSIELAKSAVYSLDPAVTLPTFAEILKTVRVTDEPRDVPFPQADDVRRVIDVVEAVAQGFRSRDALTDRNDFASRQAGYYADAARYLGLIVRAARGDYALSPAGRSFVRSISRRNSKRFAPSSRAPPCGAACRRSVVGRLGSKRRCSG